MRLPDLAVNDWYELAQVLRQGPPEATTTFEVAVPVQAPRPRDRPSSAPSTGSAKRSPMRILIVDDQRAARRVLFRILDDLADVELAEAKSLTEAIASIDASPPDLVLLDIRLSSDPDELGGLDLLRRVGQTHPGLWIVIVTSSSEIDVIRQAMRLGAKDYVLKDELSPELLVPIVEGLRERMNLRGEVARLRERVERVWGLSAIVGTSPAIERVRELIRRVAHSDATILIRGETGAGKEMVARALHELSPRSEHPFLAINCSALPPTLMESLMFGHERGAFTGADSRKPGQFELAGKGTILLDEVAEMPLELQAKLLRVLEDRRFRPLGAAAEIPLTARVLASTHVDLESRLANGQLRDDLYYRLNVVSIIVPSLAARREDIPELVHAFAAELPRKIRFTSDAMTWLECASWPGNVRELRNMVERVSLLSEQDTVDRAVLEGLAEKRSRAALSETDRLISAILAMPESLGSKLEILERAVMSRAIASSGGNLSAAARLLGIDRQVFARRWQKLGEHAEEEDDDE
jgi:DNA-binding NtrC family response regulator